MHKGMKICTEGNIVSDEEPEDGYWKLGNNLDDMI